MDNLVYVMYNLKLKIITKKVLLSHIMTLRWWWMDN